MSVLCYYPWDCRTPVTDRGIFVHDVAYHVSACSEKYARGTATAGVRLATPQLRAALIVRRFKVFALKRKEA